MPELPEVETDKISNSIESPVHGILLKIVAQEGEVLPVKGIHGYIGLRGEVGGSLKKLLALLGSNLCKLSWNFIKRLRVNHALGVLFEVPRRVCRDCCREARGAS